MIVKLTKNEAGTFELRNRKGSVRADGIEIPTLAERLKSGESIHVWAEIQFTAAGPRAYVKDATPLKGQTW